MVYGYKPNVAFSISHFCSYLLTAFDWLITSGWSHDRVLFALIMVPSLRKGKGNKGCWRLLIINNLSKIFTFFYWFFIMGKDVGLWTEIYLNSFPIESWYMHLCFTSKFWKKKTFVRQGMPVKLGVLSEIIPMCKFSYLFLLILHFYTLSWMDMLVSVWHVNSIWNLQGHLVLQENKVAIHFLKLRTGNEILC